MWEIFAFANEFVGHWMPKIRVAENLQFVRWSGDTLVLVFTWHEKKGEAAQLQI